MSERGLHLLSIGFEAGCPLRIKRYRSFAVWPDQSLLSPEIDLISTRNRRPTSHNKCRSAADIITMPPVITAASRIAV